MAEHSTVNRRVTGSSPVGGAKLKASERSSEAFPFSRRDSNAVTTALGAGAGAPTPNFVWSSPVGGANIARAPERSSGALAIYVPLARTSNPSGLRPRRGKDFWFLARSENLRLASSSPVGTFPLSREPVTTPPYVSAGALPSGSVWFESSRNVLFKS